MAISFDAFGLDTCLTFRTLLPTHFRTLITSYMNVFRREKLDDLRQYILQKLHSLVITGTNHIVRDSPLFPHLIRTSGTPQFRIRGQCRLLVPRKIYFRNNRDMAFGCVCYHFPDFVLRIKSAIRFSVIFSAIMADYGLASLRTHLSQFRIFFDFDTPSLVIAQMPMEPVYMVQCQHIQIYFNGINRKEMPAHIQHHTSIGKTRIIVYCHCRKHHFTSFRIYRNRFAKRLNAIKYSGLRRSGYFYPLMPHFQAVPFGMGYILIQSK